MRVNAGYYRAREEIMPVLRWSFPKLFLFTLGCVLFLLALFPTRWEPYQDYRIRFVAAGLLFVNISIVFP